MRKQGEVRSDGYIFWGKRVSGQEQWLSSASYHRQKIRCIAALAKSRAASGSVPFDLDTDYLVSIFPPDKLCPILGTRMEWGALDGDRSSCPSLDRIIPELGYVKGNVAWISLRANRLKDDASLEELQKIVAYVRGHLKQETIH